MMMAKDPETSQVTKLIHVLEMLALNNMPHNFVNGIGISDYISSLSYSVKRLERSIIVPSMFISAQATHTMLAVIS